MKSIMLLGVVLPALMAVADDNAPGRGKTEDRDARKAKVMNRFDLDGNGRLDQAERNVLREELKSKADPVRKRILVPKNASNTQTNVPDGQAKPR